MTPTNRSWATALVMLGLVLGTGCEGLFGGGASSGLTGLDGGVCDKSYGQRFEERTCDQGCVTGTHCGHIAGIELSGEQGEPCADPFRDLSRVEDVLIRFDYASVDNLPL